LRKALLVLTALIIAVTFSVPAQAAPSLKPTVTYVDNSKPAVSGGTPITISGKNLDSVTSVAVDNSIAVVVSKTTTTLTFNAPQHALGVATVLVTNPAGFTTFAITYSPQRRPVVPSPVLPASLKVGKSFTVVGQNTAWTVTLKSANVKICTVKKNVVKAVKKGTCSLTIDVNPDTETGSNPNWRAKQIQDSILIN